MNNGSANNITIADEYRRWIDKRVLGKYRIKRWLDDGYFATVYIADDNQSSMQQVVAKIMHDRHVGKKDKLSAFQIEVEVLLCLQRTDIHNHIVRFIDYGYQRISFLGLFFRKYRVPILIMEYIQDNNLESFITDHGPLSENEAIEIIYQYSVVLDTALSEGIIHNDIQAKNIFWDGHKIKVADWNAAILFDTSNTNSYSISEEVLDDISDVGGLFFQLITGEYIEKNYSYQFLTEELSKIHISLDVIHIITRALQANTKSNEIIDRYTGYDRLINDLIRVRSHLQSNQLNDEINIALGNHPNLVRSLYSKGRAALQGGDYLDAAKFFVQLLQANPSFVNAKQNFLIAIQEILKLSIEAKLIRDEEIDKRFIHVLHLIKSKQYQDASQSLKDISTSSVQRRVIKDIMLEAVHLGQLQQILDKRIDEVEISLKRGEYGPAFLSIGELWQNPACLDHQKYRILNLLKNYLPSIQYHYESKSSTGDTSELQTFVKQQDYQKATNVLKMTWQYESSKERALEDLSQIIRGMSLPSETIVRRTDKMQSNLSEMITHYIAVLEDEPIILDDERRKLLTILYEALHLLTTAPD